MILLALTLVFVLGFGTAHALESITADVVEYDGSSARIHLSWSHDGASYYEAGCVSCIPNHSQHSTQNSVILDGVMPFVDGNVLLYVIAYDSQENILDARQVVIELRT